MKYLEIFVAKYSLSTLLSDNFDLYHNYNVLFSTGRF